MTSLAMFYTAVSLLAVFALGIRVGRTQPRRSSLRPLQPVLHGSRVVEWARNSNGRN